MATRWAICGSGKIAHDFCSALRCLPTTEHTIVAVAASSSKAKAEEFAKRHSIPNSYGSYDELLQNDDIDVVYVNTIHPYHVETCLKFINASKAVLCEKPMSLTLEGCKRVLNAAKEKGVLFVEAYWSRFFPVYAFIRDQIDSGNLGEIKMVEINFCLAIIGVPRLINKDYGGGALMDFGCYTVQASNFIFKEAPEKIWSDGTVCPEHGVDTSGVIVLRYSGGRFATLNYSMETRPGKNDMIIRGTKGTIEIPDYFWCPKELIINGERKEFPLPEIKDQKFNFDNSEGLAFEAQGVRHCLVNGLKESPNISHAESESIMTIIQQILNNFGISYNAP